MKKIDLDTWYRTEKYLQYKKMACPLYGRTVQVDVTQAYDYCKEKGISFFIFSLYVFLRGCNQIPQFRHCEIKGEVFDMESLSATTPIMTDDEQNGQFLGIIAPYCDTFSAFLEKTQNIINQAKRGEDTAPQSYETEAICLSCLPWSSFTDGIFGYLSHDQSLPILDWGKFETVEGKKMMPYTVRVNHMFVDIYHLGQFVNLVQDCFNNPAEI